MKKKICFLLSFVLLAIVLGVGPACAEFIWCTEYVASEFGIKAYPDAKNWWTDSRISLLAIRNTAVQQ